MPIGHGQTNSQPTTVRHLLQWLDVSPGQRVLDVGSGSGWTTGLIGHLVGPNASVEGVEAYDMPWARIEPALPGVLGLPDDAPFDRILVSAEAARVPPELVEQLAPGGLMVVPVSGRLCVVRRPSDPDEEAAVERHGYYRFVPLVEPEADR